MLGCMHFERGPKARQRRFDRRRNFVAFLSPIIVMLGVPTWFLFPPGDALVASDAVLVMAGAADGRHELGAQLIGEGISQNFVVSNSAGTTDVVGSSHCRGEKRPVSAVGVWCMRSDPATTAGEAMAIGRLAEDEGWTSLTAITNRPHVRRVRTMFEQCTKLDVAVVPVDYVDITRMPYHMAREVGGYIKFWLTDPCRDFPESSSQN